MDVEDTLHIKRIIAKNGRHRIYLNGQRITLTILTMISKGLVDIIGQHASHDLLSTDSHIEILDNFAGIAKEVAVLEQNIEHFRGLHREVLDLKLDEVRQLK